ncbi:transcription antiterminator BglG [Enterococcus florum]|uniref:Transcription antiterminator BglG n=1 Tax=Enterococcus florum TaxID=2480627 RepID=A0A4P5PBL5_9ENTE|nr:transcription antiterminator [Enterococcus florum]GCF92832.1 transcription antiterminator BglG [Enterococcus florum]
MYFSVREKKILSLLLTYPNGVQLEQLRHELNVSKRTIYREISSIEKTIKPLDVQIIKPRGEGYRIVGESINLDKLKDEIEENKEDLFTDNVQRQGAIVSSLLLMDEEETIEGLSIDFQVSPSTIVSDLQAIEQSLEDYRLQLQRLKGRGIKITGREKEKRQILGNLIFNGVSEYDFFQFIDQLDAEAQVKTDNFFLKQLTPQSLYLAKTILYHIPQYSLKEVTDNQLQRILILLALSIDRIRQQRFVEEEQDSSPKPESMQIAGQIMIKVATECGHSIPAQEVRFFAYQLEGINYKKPQNIFIDHFDVELSYQIKELIRLVSEESGLEFRKDEQLFNDLLTHMAAALKRNITVLPNVVNPILQKVQEKYHTLTDAVTKELAVVFPDHTFSEDELGYVVVHFATSLERHPSSKGLFVLVLCSSGIGTARILESRIKKYLPEIQQIQVAKISEMNQLNFKQYDLILATVFLPEFTLPYKVISPLLLDEEIQELRTYIHELRPETERIVEDVPVVEPSDAFGDLYETMRTANQLLNHLEVQPFAAEETIELTLEKIIGMLQGTIVSNAEYVTQKVIDRYIVAPIGVPKTNFALFHSANKQVQEPFFAIYDLDKAFSILGMDKKSIQLTRVLLLLAPDPMPEAQKGLLGKISSSVIESDLNTEIYKFGNHELVYQLLSSLFIKEIKQS